MSLQTLPMDIIWQYTKDGEGVRILRVHSYQPEITLPNTIEGVPVTEIGSYCFSGSEPKFVGEHFHTNETTAENTPAACGNFVSMIHLPAHLHTLHNGAFYNCRKLKKLSFGTQMKSIGSDVFTNCRELKMIDVRAEYMQATGISIVLERLESDLLVSFVLGKEAKVFLPEYYEWLDEIGPAHIFSRSIEGEGFRMRRAFSNHVFDFDKYDQCFTNAVSTESKKVLCEIVYWRLLYPIHLSAETKDTYEKVVRENAIVFFEEAVRYKDITRLMFPVTHFSLDVETLSQAQNLCLEADWAQGSTLLMEAQQRIWQKKPKKFDFDDFD